MEQYIARMQRELDDLKGKERKLHYFMLSDKFKNLSPTQRDLMKQQDTYMKGYLDCLSQRLVIEGAIAPSEDKSDRCI